jgi:hypothetical protein
MGPGSGFRPPYAGDEAGPLEVHVPQSLADPRARWTAVTDEPLVLATIERSDEAWLSAETIAGETGLPLERIQMALDTAPAVVVADPANGTVAPARYSTLEHYRATTGLLRRYVDAILSS